MAGKNQHVVPHGDQWAVRGEGNSRATKLCGTQRDAIHEARTIARHQRSELFIHRQNGRIRERNTYGRDSFPPHG
ncbi:MAG: DUF2188 domain-containing protein [Kiloniellales bacterium]